MIIRFRHKLSQLCLCWLSIQILALSSNLFADENLKDEPHPPSADTLPTTFDTHDSVAPDLAETRLDQLDTILTKSSLKIKPRNYYYNQMNNDGTQQLAWAQGGIIEHRIGKVGGIFSMKTEWFSSYALYAPNDEGGTSLLAPPQREIGVFGIVNPRFDLDTITLSLYRQRFDLPFLNANDSRMLPITHQGYTISSRKNPGNKFDYIAGYIDSIKKQDSEHFVSMTSAAGVSEVKHGLYLLSANYRPIDSISIGAAEYYTQDLYNTFFTETAYKKKYTDYISNTLSFQYVDQRSVGDDLLLGTDHTTGMWGIQEAFGYRNAIFKLAFNQIDTGANLNAPFGSFPGYTSAMINDFNQAGTRSWLVGLTYDFSRLGLPGLALSTSYISGDSSIDQETKASLNNETETDVTLDYRFVEGFLKNLRLRARSGFNNEQNVGMTTNYRLIVNYEIPLWN